MTASDPGPDDAAPGGRRPGPGGVLDSLRDGWHALGGGDAAECPGCPVCRLSESAGRLDPATAEHLQQAVGHVVSAGRELLAALAPGGGAPGPTPGDAAPEASSPEASSPPGTASADRGVADTGPPPGPGDARLADPRPAPGPVRTRIPVVGPTDRPDGPDGRTPRQTPHPEQHPEQHDEEQA
ncbi:hypothetical protein [Jannaschia sp. R86511]|uniref:hypothetical protein n=1 Tax=Jannaschia sp. R86511 TaxID=3093853 RepID=UPI0036D2E955